VKPGNLTVLYRFRQGAKSCGKNPKDEEFIDNDEFRRPDNFRVFFCIYKGTSGSDVISGVQQTVENIRNEGREGYKGRPQSPLKNEMRP